MQAADFFAALPIAGAQAQGQGRGAAASEGMAGLFGNGEGEVAGEGLLDATGFAEALFAVLAVPAQPQQQAQLTAPAPDGEAALASALPPAASSNPDLLFLDPDAAAASLAPEGIEDAPVAADTFAAPTAATAAPATAPATGKVAEPAQAQAAPEFAQAAETGAETDADAAETKTTHQGLETALTHVKSQVAETRLTALAAAAAVPGAVKAETPAAAPASSPLPATPDVEAAAAPAPVSPTVPPPAAPPTAAVQAAPRPSGPEAPRAPGRAKADAPAVAVAQADAAEGPSAAKPAVAPVATLTDAAVAAPGAPDAEVAALADDPAPPTVHLPAHAQAAAHAQVFDAPQATPQTVALLSAQIAKGLENGKSTHFQVQLDPAGLGKVDVKIEIKASGDIRADLSFESPIAAAELRARSGELQTALERAGFDPSKTQLSFNSGGQHMGGQFAQDFWQGQQQQQNQPSWRGAAFMDLAETPISPVADYYASAREGGVDVRI